MVFWGRGVGWWFDAFVGLLIVCFGDEGCHFWGIISVVSEDVLVVRCQRWTFWMKCHGLSRMCRNFARDG